MSVKHLNPRQGITTIRPPPEGKRSECACVKHLNPRQGITTDKRLRIAFDLGQLPV